MTSIDDTLPAQLAAIVGARNVMTAEDDKVPYLREWRDLYRGTARAVVRPASTEEVVAIIKLANATGTPVVPQGGNTGLVGGQIPVAEGREIILSLTRMDKVRAVNAAGDTLTVEAGVTLQQAQDRGCRYVYAGS